MASFFFFSPAAPAYSVSKLAWLMYLGKDNATVRHDIAITALVEEQLEMRSAIWLIIALTK